MKVDHILLNKGTTVATIHPDAPVQTLLEELSRLHIGAMVVSNDGASVDGIVSERDVVRGLVAQGGDLLNARVSSIMTHTVQCAPPDAHVSDLMALMTEKRFRHIPVLDEENRMVGIVSIGDIVKHRLGELEGERDALIQYVTTGG